MPVLSSLFMATREILSKPKSDLVNPLLKTYNDSSFTQSEHQSPHSVSKPSVAWLLSPPAQLSLLLPLLLLPWVTHAEPLQGLSLWPDCSSRCLLATSVNLLCLCLVGTFSIASNLLSCFEITSCMPFSPCFCYLKPTLVFLLFPSFCHLLTNHVIHILCFLFLSAPLKCKLQEDRNLCLFYSVTYLKYLELSNKGTWYMLDT